MPAAVVIRIFAEPPEAPKAMVVVLSSEIVSHERLPCLVSVLNRVAPVKQLRMPDQNIACLRREHRGLSSAPFQFRGDIFPKVRHLIRNGIRSAVREKKRRNPVASGVIAQRAGS